MLQYCVLVSLCYNSAGGQRVKTIIGFQNKQKRKVTMLTNYLIFHQSGSTEDFWNSFKILYLMLVKGDQ